MSLIGRPNAGKSTLLNALMGEKLAIVSDKPQTTRTTIQGVANLAGAQVVFIDTPGIHKSTTLFNQRMMETVRTALADRDVLLYVADATAAFLRSKTAEAVAALKNLSDAHASAAQQNRSRARQAPVAAADRAIQIGPRIRRIYSRSRRTPAKGWTGCARPSSPGSRKARPISRPTI